MTVEEAARLIRVGRTKAYAMTREWRATGGRSGLPVLDFGHVLRVPRHQLEVLLGGPLDADERPAPPVGATPSRPSVTEPPPSPPRRKTNKNHQPKNQNQPQLFNPNPTATARTPNP